MAWQGGMLGSELLSCVRRFGLVQLHLGLGLLSLPSLVRHLFLLRRPRRSFLHLQISNLGYSLLWSETPLPCNECKVGIGGVYEDLFFKFGFGYVDVLFGRTGHVLELLSCGLHFLALGLSFAFSVLGFANAV